MGKEENEQYIYTDKFNDKNISPLLTYQLSEGLNEETARIGRILLDSIAISNSQAPISNRSISKNTRLILEEQEKTIEDYDEGKLNQTNFLPDLIISLYFYTN